MKIINENTFGDYLHRSPLEHKLYFDSQMMTNYHWANDLSALKKFRKDFSNDQQLMKRYSDLEEKISNLKEVNVWLSSQQDTIQTNLYNVYESFLDPNINAIWDNLDNIMISCIDEVGPYSLLNDMRWFDDNVYSYFVYLKLIRSWMCERQFRMSVNIPIELSVHECPLIKARATYHQVSESGIVIKLEKQLMSMFRINSSIDICKKSSHRPNLVKGDRYELSSHCWWNELGDLNISFKEFDKIIKNGASNQKGNNIYLFLPSNLLKKSKNYNYDRVIKLLNTSEEIITDLYKKSA